MFTDIVSNIIGAQLGELIAKAAIIPLSGIGRGTIPKYLLPVIVPRTPGDEARSEYRSFGEPIIKPSVRLTNLGLLIGTAGFLWIVARKSEDSSLSAAQVDFLEPQEEFNLTAKLPAVETKPKKSKGKQPPVKFVTRDPKAEQETLFDAPRTMVMEVEDVATSDDPVEACMQRKGWTTKQMEKKQDSIAKKTTPDMFSEEKEPEFTASENDYMNDVQDCLDKIKAKFGSLEAAGIEEIPCDCDD